MRLTITEVIELLEYRKSNKGYWDRSKLYKLIINKALLITKALYSDYSLFFLFDNATSNFIFAQDALHITQINKKIRGQQF